VSTDLPLTDAQIEAFSSDLAPAAKPNGVPPIVFKRPSEIIAYQPPEGSCLVGNNHITMGATAVIAGAPGIGKSRAAVALAVAGATGYSWMNLKVHRRFRTMIIQCENGALRLKQEFEAFMTPEIEDMLLISPPPQFGFEFGKPEFEEAIRKSIEAFRPDLVIVDPWTAVVTDDKGKDYGESIKVLKRLTGNDDRSPALLIVAHTRKPGTGETLPKGRDLLHEVAGSYRLGSHARAVFNVLAATVDPGDDRILFINSKNNDGPMADRSAWHRRNGPFEECPGFDWKAYDQQSSKGGRSTIKAHHLRAALEGKALPRKELIDVLMEETECSRSVAYAATDLDGKFGVNLKSVSGQYHWVESEEESESEAA